MYQKETAVIHLWYDDLIKQYELTAWYITIYFRGTSSLIEIEFDDELEHNFPIHGTDLSCPHHVDSFHDCSFDNDTKQCSHYDDVYIQCK